MFLLTPLAAFFRAPTALDTRPPYRDGWWKAVRFCMLGLVTLLFLLWLRPPGTKLSIAGITEQPFVLSAPLQRTNISNGKGAGGFGTNSQGPQAATICAPFDAPCLANSVALSMAQELTASFQPITDGILSDPADIVIQTPPLDSYQDPSVMTLNTLFVETVDVALACLLLIGGYTVIVGPHFQVQSPITELLPRAILVVLAVQINLTFIGRFIDLEDVLSLAVYNTAQVHAFANLLAGFLVFDPSAGILAIIGIIILLVLGVALLIQMIARMALVALLIAVAPLGLACLILPQTVRWGRLWMMSFSTIVLVQFLQVTTLGLGVLFLTSIGTAGFFHIGTQLARIFLTIGTLSVVLKIPTLLHRGILQPMMEAGQKGHAGSDAQSSDSSSASGDAIDGASGDDGMAGSFGLGDSGGWGGGSSFGGDAFGSSAFGGGNVVEGQILADTNGELLLTFLA